MTKEELVEYKLQFEKALHFMQLASRERNFEKDDFEHLNWIVRNLDKLRNYEPEELDWNEKDKEVKVKC